MSSQSLALAIASSPEAIAQNQKVSELSREKDRLTQRVSDLANSTTVLQQKQAQLQGAIDAGAAIIEGIQATLPPGADASALAVALLTNVDAVNSSGQITNLSIEIASAQLYVEQYTLAQQDLIKVNTDLQAAIVEGAGIILAIQNAM